MPALTLTLPTHRNPAGNPHAPQHLPHRLFYWGVGRYLRPQVGLALAPPTLGI